MIIKLSPLRSDARLSVHKHGDTLTLNGVSLDFSRLEEGATLPASAIGNEWLGADVERIDGYLLLTLRLPHGSDADERSRFPVDIVDPQDGVVALPGGTDQPVSGSVPGGIDWAQVVSAAMKAAAASAQRIAALTADIAARRARADAAIAPLQDASELDEATSAELDALKAWKRYRIALNRVVEQPGYPDSVDWPAAPA